MLPRHAKGKNSSQNLQYNSFCRLVYVYLEEETEGIHDAFRSVVVQGCSEISREAIRHVRLQLAEGGGLQRLEVDLD